MSGPVGAVLVETKRRRRKAANPDDLEPSSSSRTAPPPPSSATATAAAAAAMVPVVSTLDLNAALLQSTKESLLSSNHHNNDSSSSANSSLGKLFDRSIAPDSPFCALGPQGIRNSSNNCFLNAVTQALCHVPPMVQLCLSCGPLEKTLFHHSNSSSNHQQQSSSTRSHGGAVPTPLLPSTMQSLSRWMAQYFNTTSRSMAMQPFRLAPHVEKGTVFSGLVQEDAHEYLAALLKQLALDTEVVERAILLKQQQEENNKGTNRNETTNGKPKGSSAKGTEESSKGPDSDGGGKWLTVGRGKETMMVRETTVARQEVGDGKRLWNAMFGGRLQSHLKGGASTTRNVTSVTVEPFWCLLLDVSWTGKGDPTVAELMESTFAKEIIEDEARGRDMKRQVFVGELPLVLIVQLKRWAITAEGEVVKLENRVRLLKDLVVPQQVCSKPFGAKQRSYSLCSVVSHRGASHVKGHYVSYVSADHGQSVYLCNDARVTKSSWGDAEKEAPYFLFYCQKSR